MVNVRQKGAANERAVAKMIFENMGVKLVRDLEQYRKSDRGDLRPASDFPWPFVIEIKARIGVRPTHEPAWWSQVVKAAQSENKIPVLWYKFNRRNWRVVMRLCDVAMALCPLETAERHAEKHQDDLLTMEPDTFYYLAREILAAMAEK